MKLDSLGQKQGAIDLIRDILVEEFELDDDRVIIYDERTKLPTDEGLFILVAATGDPRVISNRNIPVPLTSSMSEDQQVNLQEQITISVMSRNFEATYRRWEVFAALKSIYAQQVQEEQAFKIFPNGSISDLSALEGAAMLKRYDCNVTTFTWYSKTKVVDYYEHFSAEITTDKQAATEIPLSS